MFYFAAHTVKCEHLQLPVTAVLSINVVGVIAETKLFKYITSPLNKKLLCTAHTHKLK
jgi:hypothetical protein